MRAHLPVQHMIAEARRTDIDAFGIAYEGKSALTTSRFAWAA